MREKKKILDRNGKKLVKTTTFAITVFIAAALILSSAISANMITSTPTNMKENSEIDAGKTNVDEELISLEESLDKETETIDIETIETKAISRHADKGIGTSFSGTPILTEGFENVIPGGIPPDWTILTNSTSTYGNWMGYNYATHVYNGEWSAKGDPGTTTTDPPSDAWLITEQLSLSASPGSLTFWYQSESNSQWVAFHVLVSTNPDPADYSGYTQVADITANTTTWLQASIDMSSYANQDVYIALRMYDSSSSYWYVFVDDFALDGWFEGFEAKWLPAGWETIDFNTNRPWTYVDDPSYVHSGDYAAWINYDSVYPSDNWLITPDINLSGYSSVWLSFWAASDTLWPTATMEVHVQDGFDDVIWNMTADEDWSTFEYREVKLDLSSYIGQIINISWRYVGLDGESFGLDDVLLFEPLQHDVGVTNINDPVGTIPASTITPNATVENFGANNENNVPVWLSISKEITGATLLEEDIEGYVPEVDVFPPTGWSIVQTNPTSTWFKYLPTSSQRACCDEDGSNNEAQDEWLISETYDCSGLSDMKMEFYRYMYASTSSGDSYCEVLGSIDDGSTWPYLIQNYTATASSATEEFDISSWADDESQVKIAWHFVSTNDTGLYDYFYFDDLFIGSIVTVEVFPEESFTPPAFPPSGWAVYNVDGGDEWERYGGAYPRTGSQCARCYYDPANDDWLATGPIIVPGGGGNFSFWARGHSASYLEAFEVYYSTTGNTISDFTGIGGTLLDSTSLQSTTYLLFDYTSNMTAEGGNTLWFAIRYIGTNDFGLYVDDMTFPDGTTEGFEISFPPAGWTMESYAPGLNWTQGTAHDGGSTFVDDVTVTQDEWLITPTINCLGQSDMHLFFWHDFYRSTSSGNSYAEVYGSTDDGATWTQTIDIFMATEIADKDYDISSWADGESLVKIGFRFNSTDYASAYDDWAFDDVWVGKRTVVTLAEEYFDEVIPESGWPPSGWTHEVVSGTDADNEWDPSDGTGTHPSGVSPHGGTYMAQYDAYSISTDNSARLYTPSMNFSSYAASGFQLKFWMNHDSGYSGNDDRVDIQVSTNATTWTTIATISRYDVSAPGWLEHMVDLTAYAAETSVYVGFLGISAFGNSIYIDDILIKSIGGWLEEYNETIYVDLNAMESKDVLFPDWTPADSLKSTDINYFVRSCTNLSTDQDNSNDCAAEFTTLQFIHDVGVEEITSPEETGGPPPAMYDVDATIKNYGGYFEDFNVNAKIFKVTTKLDELIYESNYTVTNLAPGAEENAEFDDWTVTEPGEYRVEVTTELIGDENSGNDQLTKTVTIIAGKDAGVESINSPTGVNPPGSHTVNATIANYGQDSDVDWWPMFHHDIENTGHSSSTAPDTNNVLWEYGTGGTVASSPAVADGKVFFGSHDGNVYCLDASTGAWIWQYPTGDEVWSSPAVADGKVFVGSGQIASGASNVYCLDASTGLKIWNYTASGGVDSSPAVADGKVFFGSHDGNVYCLDASTGAWIWQYTTGGGVYSSPAVADGKVYFGSKDFNLYCLDASTGAWIWNYPAGSPIGVMSSPAVVEGKVFFGASNIPFGTVYCLNALTGAFIWQCMTMGTMVQSSPAVADGKVFVGAFNGNFYCLNALTGAIIWQYTTGGTVLSSPAVADGKVYFGSDDFNFYCLNALTGAIIWQHLTAGTVRSSPAVADGKVFIGSSDNSIYCFGPEPSNTITENIPVNCSIYESAKGYFSDFESDDGGWVATATWDPVGDWEWTDSYDYNQYTGSYTPPPAAYSGDGLWATVPHGDYTNAGGDSFLSQTFDFTSFTNAEINWYTWCDAFYTFDTTKLFVEGVEMWDWGTSTPSSAWSFEMVDLSAWDGQASVEIVFELHASTVVERAGWYIDDVSISSNLTRGRGPGDLVYSSETTISIPGNSTAYLEFTPPWDATPGIYSIEVTTNLSGDDNTSNDQKTEIVEIILAKDTGVTAINSPTGTHRPGDHTVNATVENFGSADQNVPVNCSIYNESDVLVYSADTTIFIPALSADDVEFAPAWHVTTPEAGDYRINVTTLLPGDGDASNDATEIIVTIDPYIDVGPTSISFVPGKKTDEITSKPTIVNATIENFGDTDEMVPVNCSIYEGFYYSEDFELDEGGYTSGGPTDIWEWGKPTDPDGPNATHSGIYCWGTNLSGDYGDSANATLDSIPIALPTGTVELVFWHWYDTEPRYDGGNVKISTNGGTTWEILGSYLDPYNEDEAASSNAGIPGEPCFSGHDQGYWEEVTFDLSNYTGETVIIRWHFGSDTSVSGYPGWYIDDVKIEGIGNLSYTSETTVFVPALSTKHVEFTPAWRAYIGSYVVQVKTNISGDENPGNDLLIKPVTVTPLCGDCTYNGVIDIGDVVFLINYLYRSGPEPIPMSCVGNINGDEIVDIGDVVYLINYLYRAGPVPDPDCCE